MTVFDAQGEKMENEYRPTALGIVLLIFCVSTGTWMFWNGVFMTARYILTGTVERF
jgi:hypothetical protein